MPGSHCCLGLFYRTIGQYDKGIEEAEKAVALGPNVAWAYAELGSCLRFSGRSEEAIPIIKKAIRLNPFAYGYLYSLGFAYLYTGQFEEAIRVCKKATDRNPNDLWSHLCLASAYSACNREEEARSAAAGVLRINPKFSVEYFSRMIKFKKQEDKELFFNGLRKAGLK